MGLETQEKGAPEKKYYQIYFIGKISVMHDIRNAHVRHESKDIARTGDCCAGKPVSMKIKQKEIDFQQNQQSVDGYS